MGGKEFKMKKQFATIVTAVAVATGAMFYALTPVAPHHYELHVVRGGETVTSIIKDANKDTNINYDVREAAAIAVAESKKMEGGAQGYTIYPGQKVAVPIYR